MTKLQPNAMHDIKLHFLQPSDTNPRKHFDKKELDDLASSIKEKGVLEPLLVRLNSGTVNSYEIVAGERRYRAAALAKLEAVPCIVRELTDLQVLEIQVVENMQRQDLTPLEEAAGYKLLHEKHGYSFEDLAAKIGKSQSYIYSRLRLLQLHPKVLKLIEEGKIPLSYGIELQRVQAPEDQVKILDDVQYPGNYGDIESVKDLRSYIDEHYMLVLADAPFDIRDADLVKGAGPCAACPKRTGAQLNLLGDAGKKDSCTDSACYQEKLKAHQAAITAKMKAKGQDVVHLKKGERFSADRRGMVDLDETSYDLKNDAKWSTALKKHNAMDKVSPVAVIDSAGKTKYYAEKKAIVAALPKAAWDYVPSVHDHGFGEKKTLVGPARVKRLAELAAVRETWPATWPKVIDQLQEAPLAGQTLRTLTDIIVKHVVRYPHDNEVRDRTGSKIEGQLSAAKSDKDLRRLLWNVALGVGLYAGNTKLTDPGRKVFGLAKFNWDSTLKVVVDRKLEERKAKAKAKAGLSKSRDQALAADQKKVNKAVAKIKAKKKGGR